MPPRDGRGDKYTLFLRRMKLSWMSAVGADVIRIHPSAHATPTVVMCVLQNNESFVKPRENPSIHPSVILPRVRGSPSQQPLGERQE